MQTRFVPVLAASLIASAAANAQTVEFVSVIKLKLHDQSSATQVDLLPAVNLPYGIDLDVGGVDIDLLSPAPSVAGPISVSEPSHNGGVLGDSLEEEEWRYGWPSFNDWGAETLGELDSLFGSGVYTMTVSGIAIPLTLTGDAYSALPPVLTLTGGSWQGSEYVIAADQELTLTTSAFVEFGSSLEDAVWVNLFGPNFDTEVFHLASENPDNFQALTVPAGALTPGETYLVDAGFTAISDWDDAIPGLPDALALAGYEMSTGLTVRVSGDGGGCNAADLSEPFGVLDFFDVSAFLNAFAAQEPPADLAEPFGVFDFFDVAAFLTAFNDGCP